MQFFSWISATKQRLITTIAAATGTAADRDRVVSTGAVSGKIDTSLLDTDVANGVGKLGPDGRFAAERMPAGFAQDVNTVIASEALNPGDNVNFWSDAGVAKVRLANATSGTEREAGGYVDAAVAVGQPARVFADGTNQNATGLVPGLPVYLDITAGKATTTAPAAPHMAQWIGMALTATSYDYQIHIATVRS